MNAYECSICCCEYKSKKKPIVCPNCNNIFCVSCQKKFEKDECMACHMKFKRNFIIEHLGKVFVNKTLTPKIIEELMKEQKETLKNVQPLVDWEKQIREQRKKLRFGIRTAIPERPKITTEKMVNAVFPCPMKDCRGFVEKGTCCICKTEICLKCREKKNIGHVCKIEDLQSIALVMSDSKQCPKCCATIFRTMGCNHMFCTNCRTHFDWVSGVVTQTSSNGHYLHLQRFSDNVPIRDVGVKSDVCDATREFSLYRDKIKKDNVIGKLQKNTLRCLWDDSNAVRLLKRKKYDEQNIIITTNESLQELQIKYLLNEITEELWSKRVYHITLKKTISFLYADILNIYLAMVDSFQQTLSLNNKDQDAIMKQYAQLVDLCNTSFQSVFDEYGGQLHHIRQTDEDDMAPSFI